MSPIYREKYRKASVVRQGRAARTGWITFNEMLGRLKSGWVIAIYVLCILQIFLFVTSSVIMASMGEMFLEKQAGTLIAEGYDYPELLVGPSGSPVIGIPAGNLGIQGVYVQNIGEWRSNAMINVYPVYASDILSGGEKWSMSASSMNVTVPAGETVHVSILIQAPATPLSWCLYTVQVVDWSEGTEFYGTGSSCTLMAMTDDITTSPRVSIDVPDSIILTAGKETAYDIAVNNSSPHDLFDIHSGIYVSMVNWEGLMIYPAGEDPYKMMERPASGSGFVGTLPANGSIHLGYQISLDSYGIARTYNVQTWYLGTNLTSSNNTLYVATGTTRVTVEQGEKYDNVARAFFHFGRGQTQFILVVLITAMAGSAALSDDINSKAISLIFSKPVTRTDYLIGKFAAVFSLISLYTVVGMSAAFIACVLLSTISFSFFIAHLWVLGVIIIRGLLASLLMTSLVLFFSSITRKRWYASVAVIALMFLSEILSLIIAIIAQRDWINMFALHRNLVQVSSVMFGLGPHFDYPWWYSLVLLAGFVCLSLGAVFLRVGRMEMSE